jgi:hypothetical protein
MKGLSKTPSGSNGDGSKSDSMASGVGAPPDAATVRPSVSSSDFESSPDKVPTAAIRNTLRALASEGGPLAGRRAVELVRPLVKRAHKVLRERFEAGGSVEAYLHDRTRLADTTIVGLLHVASVSSGMRREGSMIAPLAAVAVGGYGRGELAPGSDLDVLFLLPESGAPAAATVTCLRTVVTGLWDLGFTLDHSARSCTECLALAQDEPIVLASLLTRRFLWGGFSLYATLDAGVADLFSGPRASRWRGVVGSAMASRRNALDEPQAESEPNVKHGPGGLRDLQRVLAMNALPRALPQRSPSRRWSRRTTSFGTCDATSICSPVAPRIILVQHFKPT